MTSLALQIFDETLRDGEQQAGLFLAPDLKRELARRIADTGAHQIDLMPVMDEAEATLARALLADGLGDRLTAATPLRKRFVDDALACGFRRLILFYAVSDRLMFLRDPEVGADPAWRDRTVDDGPPAALLDEVRERTLARVHELLNYVDRGEHDVRVDFAAEDASRADPAFLARCLGEIGPRVDRFMLCDTVGVLRPERTGRWLAELLEATGQTNLAVHFHNDLGLAVENTLEAVLAGARCVSGTFRGVGERAGNAALEQVLDALRSRHGIEVDGIDYDAVEALAGRLDALGIHPASPHSRRAQWHESGIHVHSMLRDPRSYNAFLHLEPEIWFGKTSGAGNVRYLCEKLMGRPRPRSEYERISASLKRRVRREGRCLPAAEVRTLLESGALDDD